LMRVASPVPLLASGGNFDQPNVMAQRGSSGEDH